MNRLFVPLKSGPFEWFETEKKKWELRGISSRFNRNTVKEGRTVELRKGYNGKSIWGKIESVKTFESLETVPEFLNFRKIIPPASDEEEFLERARGLLKGYESFIAFKVRFG